MFLVVIYMCSCDPYVLIRDPRCSRGWGEKGGLKLSLRGLWPVGLALSACWLVVTLPWLPRLATFAKDGIGQPLSCHRGSPARMAMAAALPRTGASVWAWPPVGQGKA